MNDSKKCPYCAEDIKAEAVICRFCGRDLPETVDEEAVAEAPPSTPARKRSRLRVILVLVAAIAILCCGSIVLFGSFGDSELSDDEVTQPTVGNEDEAVTRTVQVEETEPPRTPTSSPTSRFLVIAVAKQNSNLRSGPGAAFDVVGSAAAGESLSVYNRDDSGEWLRVEPDEEVWIWAELVELQTEIASIPILPTPLPTDTPTSTPRPINTPRPTSTRDPLRPLVAALEDALGDSEREGVKRVEVRGVSDGIMFVTFSVQDALVTEWTRQGMLEDVLLILRTVNNGAIDYDTVSIEGTFPLRDTFGNVEEGLVLGASYSRQTIEQINFNGLVEVFTIADQEPFVHPDFR